MVVGEYSAQRASAREARAPFAEAARARSDKDCGAFRWHGRGQGPACRDVL